MHSDNPPNWSGFRKTLSATSQTMLTRIAPLLVLCVLLHCGCNPVSPPKPRTQTEPISLHREQCLTCLNLQVHLYQADQYKQKTLGFSLTDDKVVQQCRSGMVHVNKAKQRLQSAQVLNCLGIDELQKWTNELEVFFKRRQQTYAKDP